MEQLTQNLEQIPGKKEEKKESLGKIEENILRHEIEKVKAKVDEAYSQNKKSAFFSGLEILDVNVGELPQEDLLRYSDLKEYMKGKLPFEEIFKRESRHRVLIGEYITERLEKEAVDFDYTKDSRVAFTAWRNNKLLDIFYQKRVAAKNKK